MIEKIIVTMYECECNLCGYAWSAYSIPVRCAGCRSSRWDEDPDRIEPRETRSTFRKERVRRVHSEDGTESYAARKKRHRLQREAEADGKFLPEEWESLKEKYNHECLRCGSSEYRLVPDHILSLFLGGSNQIYNIQPLCVRCNLWKGAYKIIDFRPDADKVPIHLLRKFARQTDPQVYHWPL